MKTYRYSLAATLVAINTILTARADYSSTVSSFNPATYWRLNETTPVPLGDAATNRGTLGVAAAGFYLSGANHPVTGIPGGGSDTAANIPNTDHSWGPMRVRVPFLPALNQPRPFTAEFWAKPDQQGTIVCPFASADFSQPTRHGWLFYQDNPAGQWFFRVYNAAGNTAVQGGTVTAGVWHHVVGVYDGTNLLLYVNGAKVGGPTAMSGAFTPVTNPNIPLAMGGRSDGVAGSFGYSGDMDEVAFYTNVLTDAEIQAHYQAGSNPATADYGALILAKDPAGYWRLGEPAFVPPDPSTYPVAANTGTLGAAANGIDYPGITTGVAGPPFAGLGAGNHAYLFDGGSGHIDCGQPADLDAYAGPMTIMTWINVSQWSKTWQAIVTKGDSSWRFHRNGDTRTIGFGTTGLNPQDLAGTRPVDDGFWHHVVVVYDGSAKSIYVDGTLDVQTSVSGALAPNAFPIFIGDNAQATSPSRSFSGAMDEVAIFTNGLTAAQILQIYNAAQPPPIVTQVQRTPADPLFEGYNITLTAAAMGGLPMTNQWYKNNSLLTVQTNLTLSIPNATVGDSGSYTLVVANAYGSTTSAVQVITVSAGPPLFLSQNIFDATRAIGGRVIYSVVAGGSSPISYQWKHNTTPIPGATSSALKLIGLQDADQGAYTVTLTNPYGSANSSTGTVAVFTVTNYAFAGMYGAPLAYYRLNETSGTTASDIAGALNGTITGPMVLGVTGPRPPFWASLESTNTGFQFDGSSTRVQLPSFNLQTNQMTIVAWINPNGSQKDQTGILASRTPAGLGGFFLNYNHNDALSYVWEGTSSWSTFQSGLQPTWNTWNFTALVVDPQNGTIYLDKGDGTGLQSASFHPPEGNKTVPWDSPNIGVDSGYDRWFNGSIDEVIVYDRALSPAEIANLDLLSTASPWPPPLITGQPSPVTVYAGQPASFAVGALGGVPLLYQWQHAGTNLPGATSATFTIPSVYYTDAGSYKAAITNSSGSSNSVTATLTVLAPPTFANLTNDLVLHLKFDGDYLDASGRANNATPQGIPGPTFVPGKLGQAVSVNTVSGSGVFNYVYLGLLPDFAFAAADSFSVAFWVNFTNWPNDLPMIGNAVGSTYQLGWCFAQDKNEIELSLVSTANSGTYVADPVGGSPIINDGLWHNIVGVIDRGSQFASVYVDGAPAGSFPIAGLDTLDYNTALTIGQNPNGDYAVDGAGSFDDVGIWRRALTPTEAEAIYMVGQQGRSFDTYGPVILSLRKAGNDLELVWQTGTLLSSTTGVLGTYDPVPGASAPYYRVTPGPASTFYRVKF